MHRDGASGWLSESQRANMLRLKEEFSDVMKEVLVLSPMTASAYLRISYLKTVRKELGEILGSLNPPLVSSSGSHEGGRYIVFLCG